MYSSKFPAIFYLDRFDSNLTIYSRQNFYNLLRQNLSRTSYYKGVTDILLKDPYFVPGYLEVLWGAEEFGDKDLFENTLRKSVLILSRIYVSSTLRRALLERWSYREIQAFKLLLSTALKVGKFSLFEKLTIRTELSVAGKFFKARTVLSDKEGKYLKFIKNIETSSLKKELFIPPRWVRSGVHKHNKALGYNYAMEVTLRKMPQNISFEYLPVDGVHESVETYQAKKFPQINKIILGLSKELNIGLGRVLIAAMQPFDQIYRHCDEFFLLQKNSRQCYHLVLESGEGDLLESGDEQVFVKNGDLWFIGNDAMRRHHSLSRAPVVHVIFEGYPLKGIQEEVILSKLS